MKISICYLLHDESYLIENTLYNIFEKSKHDLTLNLELTSGIFNDEMLSIASKIHSRYGGKLNSSFKNLPIKMVNFRMKESYLDENADIFFVGSPDYSFDNTEEFDIFIDKASSFLDSKFFISSIREHGDGAVFQSGIYTKLGLEKIGYLDQNFIPCESSDSDYHKRCCLYYGLNSNNIFDSPYRADIICKASHHNHHFYKKGSSPPIKNFNKYLQNVFLFNKLNTSYFSKKWGPNKDYTFPFSKQKYNLKIAWDQVNNPYPDEFHNSLTPFF